MARKYPRFLLSHVVDGKSTGIFITHLLHPICLFKFEWKQPQGYTFIHLDDWGEEVSALNLQEISEALKSFITKEIVAGRLKG